MQGKGVMFSSGERRKHRQVRINISLGSSGSMGVVFAKRNSPDKGTQSREQTETRRGKGKLAFASIAQSRKLSNHLNNLIKNVSMLSNA